MSDIEIVKGVPLPGRSNGRKNVYPWDKLGVGDHFTFPKETKKTTASALSYRAAKVSGKAFAIRTMADGIKCWRTA